MNLPLPASQVLWLAIPMGLVFGVLLHRGGVTSYDVVVNQFRLRDHTVLKVMLTAVVVGGLGVWALHGLGHAEYHIKPANLLAVGVGGVVFGVGMALYGYCPGTGIAAVATGKLDALIGVAGMLAGGAVFGLSYGWLRDHVEGIWALGKVRLPEWTRTPEAWWQGGLLVLALVVFWFLEQSGGSGDAPQGKKGRS